MRRLFGSILVLALAILLGVPALRAGEMKPIDLPEPQVSGGMPLMDALMNRKSDREFSAEKLPARTLSDLLWAAFGVNRPESGKRTAPSARNWREIDIYVALEKGLYLYDAVSHSLNPVLPDDLRSRTGMQDFVGAAPVNLVYVADYSRMGNASDDQKIMYAAADAAFIAQNVYLFCASEGLGTVVRGALDREALAKAMKLGPERHVAFAQTVGYVKE
ncbi:MAG TPA: SagB/ThcOx family dehydrogenase [Candidatus Eisenbacteria bacterium]|uniref:SagB/ThcOx family dehydrogenase n=1 Tax=Eiseniibacteriota bacterium TaxID=2212470 RepID=A0A7V2AVW9_UNCEI|nr:SagB/ThcOx family dehydrogenase [Candidatus Eisenbacteria bacterium]